MDKRDDVCATGYTGVLLFINGKLGKEVSG
jgi:hypothetical protein